MEERDEQTTLYSEKVGLIAKLNERFKNIEDPSVLNFSFLLNDRPDELMRMAKAS